MNNNLYEGIFSSIKKGIKNAISNYDNYNNTVLKLEDILNTYDVTNLSQKIDVNTFISYNKYKYKKDVYKCVYNFVYNTVLVKQEFKKDKCMSTLIDNLNIVGDVFNCIEDVNNARLKATIQYMNDVIDEYSKNNKFILSITDYPIIAANIGAGIDDFDNIKNIYKYENLWVLDIFMSLLTLHIFKLYKKQKLFLYNSYFNDLANIKFGDEFIRSLFKNIDFTLFATTHIKFYIQYVDTVRKRDYSYGGYRSKGFYGGGGSSISYNETNVDWMNISEIHHSKCINFKLTNLYLYAETDNDEWQKVILYKDILNARIVNGDLLITILTDNKNADLIKISSSLTYNYSNWSKIIIDTIYYIILICKDKVFFNNIEKEESKENTESNNKQLDKSQGKIKVDEPKNDIPKLALHNPSVVDTHIDNLSNVVTDLNNVKQTLTKSSEKHIVKNIPSEKIIVKNMLEDIDIPIMNINKNDIWYNSSLNTLRIVINRERTNINLRGKTIKFGAYNKIDQRPKFVNNIFNWFKNNDYELWQVIILIKYNKG